MFTGQLATGSTSFIHQNVFVTACESCTVIIYSVRLPVVPLSDSECKGRVKRNGNQVKVSEGEEGKRFSLCSSTLLNHSVLRTITFFSLAFCYAVCVSEVVSLR